MKKILTLLLFLCMVHTLQGQFSQHPNAALAGTGTPSAGIIFSPNGGSSFGGTQFVGLSYPTVPSASIVFTLGPLCTNPAVTCPAGSSVLSYASALYTGPSCIPTSTCTSSAGGFGTPIKATITGTGTTINALAVQATVTQQNNLSTTSLPAGWFPTHWKYITPNTFSTNPVSIPTSGTSCGGPCAGNILTTGTVCYLSGGSCSGGGVGSVGTLTSVWVIPGATPPVTAPIDPTTGLPAKATYIGYRSSAQNQSGYGHPQSLYTSRNAQSCGNPTICTWEEMDFWILADGSPIAGWESDMQQGEPTNGSFTSALQCRVHGNASPLTAGWGYGTQLSGLTQIPNTGTSNCPSSTAWLHVMYLSTFNLTAVPPTFTIQTLTLQSVPGGPAGATGLAVFPVNKTFNVDPKDPIGTSCTDQFQLDQWCAPGNVCNTSQIGGEYIALNNNHCGTGNPPLLPVQTQVYQ